MVNILDYGFEVVDVDLSEFYHNFPLDSSMQLASGVDLTPYKTDLLELHLELKVMHPNVKKGDQNEDPSSIAVWNRSWMGYKPSPFRAIRTYYHAEEFIMGYVREDSNPFRYDTIIFNLPRNEISTQH